MFARNIAKNINRPLSSRAQFFTQPSRSYCTNRYGTTFTHRDKPEVSVAFPDETINPDHFISVDDLEADFCSPENTRARSWDPPRRAKIYKELDKEQESQLESLAQKPETTASQLEE